MSTLRKLAGLVLASTKPGMLVAGALALLVFILVAIVVTIAIFSRNKDRRTDAQLVLRTLFNRRREWRIAEQGKDEACRRRARYGRIPRPTREGNQLRAAARPIALTDGIAGDGTMFSAAPGFGLGVQQLTDQPIGTVWTYEGGTLGYRAEHFYFPRSGIIIALAVNSATGADNDELGTLAVTVYQTLQNEGAVHPRWNALRAPRIPATSRDLTGIRGRDIRAGLGNGPIVASVALITARTQLPLPHPERAE
jgi:hypothetical protein